MKREIKKAEVLAKLGNIERVTNMPSPNTYREIPNQFGLFFERGKAFQSYGSLIAVRLYGDDTWYFTSNHDYSRTTCKYCKIFCGLDLTERRRMLANGEAVGIVE